MSIENLKSLIPDYAKDLRLNLGSIATTQSALSETQLWGTLLATALAGRNARVTREIAEEAAAHLTPEQQNAAKSAAAIMAMNNIYYRTMHQIEDKDYARLPARLRMQVLANPGAEKVDFEMWSLAVSAVNGCGMCINAHIAGLLKLGVEQAAIQDAIRVASIVHAVAATLDGEAALGE